MYNCTLQQDITTWAVKTFGEYKDKQTLFNRMLSEWNEVTVDNKLNKPLTPELVDVLHFMFQIAETEGYDLLEETYNKFQVNKKRNWVLNNDGTGQHIHAS